MDFYINFFPLYYHEYPLRKCELMRINSNGVRINANFYVNALIGNRK